jgi:hypothetical protein
MTSNDTNKHRNREKTVICPVEGCDQEVLSRGLHLHVRQSTSGDHGPQGEIPSDVDLDKAEPAGEKEVEMEYPEERDVEEVFRLCPYCRQPFRGKHNAMIHLGQTAGRKNHPENPKERHDPEDLPIVQVDDDKNVVEFVEEGTSMPSTERRQEREEPPDHDEVREQIEDLREQGLDEMADKFEQMLLGN